MPDTTHIQPLLADIAAMHQQLAELEQTKTKVEASLRAAQSQLAELIPMWHELLAGKQSTTIDQVRIAYSKEATTVEPYRGENWDSIAARAAKMPEAQQCLNIKVNKPALKVQPADLLARLRVKLVEGSGYKFSTKLDA